MREKSGFFQRKNCVIVRRDRLHEVFGFGFCLTLGRLFSTR